MVWMYFVLFLIILMGSLGIVYISFYNRMQTLKSKIQLAESNIDESLRLRYDTIMQADELITSITKKNYFKDFKNLKEEELSTFAMERKLSEAYHLICELREDKEDIHNNKDMKNIIKTLKENEEKLTAEKNYFNKNTSLLNSYVRKFPSNIIARIHQITILPFFDGKDMQDENINDFKL